MKETNVIDFTTLNIVVKYNANLLKNSSDATTVSHAVHYIVRNAEKEQANKKIQEIKEKVADSSMNGSIEALTDAEKKSWDNYNAHIKMLNKFIEKTGFTPEKWESLNDVDKVFLQLIALPNIPKTFAASIEFVDKSHFVDLMNIAEKYYSKEKFSTKEKNPLNEMKNQLAYNLFTMKHGGNIFHGVKLKPNATDTKKFLALFVTDIKLNANNEYDFAVLWHDKTKTQAVQIAVNKFIAMYITNRMDNVIIAPAEEDITAEETE